VRIRVNGKTESGNGLENMADHEDEIYRLEHVPIFEALYGHGLISLGSYPAVDQMFTGVDLDHKHLLDIGSGIGGMAHYLATTFEVRVTGLEVRAWMADYAAHATPEPAVGRVHFLTYDAQGNIPLPSSCIDLAYSKGVLTNVADKRRLFQEVVRVLQPGGEICLIDWLVPPEVGPKTERSAAGEWSHKETEASYSEILASCGFQQIECQDVNREYLTYVKELAEVLSAPEHIERYREVLSAERRRDLLASNAKLMHAIEAGEQFSCRIRAALEPRFVG